VEACTQGLAAGRDDGYRLAAATAAANGRALDGPAVRPADLAMKPLVRSIHKVLKMMCCVHDNAVQ